MTPTTQSLEQLAERERRIGESPLEYQKRMYRPLMSLDAICGFERDESGLVVRRSPRPTGGSQ